MAPPPPGNGHSVVSGTKKLVKEGGDGSASVVGMTYVGRRGSKEREVQGNELSLA